jgi:hypothetical protein
MNSSLTEEVSKDEVQATLSSMQKGKSLTLDGIMVEFLLGFYDLQKEYI